MVSRAAPRRSDTLFGERAADYPRPMGSWGTGVLANDQAMDVWEYYGALVEDGRCRTDIKTLIFSNETDDERPALRDNSFFWFGFAKAQLDHGHLDEDVVTVIETIVDEGIDIEDYWTAKPGLREQREKVQRDFLEELRRTLHDES